MALHRRPPNAIQPAPQVAKRGAPGLPARKPGRRVKENVPVKRARAAHIYSRLASEYPNAHCELDYRNAYELLVATILSAQCTDKRVNMVTPVLFAKYADVVALASAKHADVEEIIKSTGFFRAKTKSLIGMAGAVVDRHHGRIPAELQLLVGLPGVGRKTANVVLGNAFGVNEGVVVDTHVARLSKRLDLSRDDDPIKIERDLMALFPREQWAMLSHLLIWHGRRICVARKPKCGGCAVAELCPSAFRV